MIVDFVKDHNFLPPVLFLNMDNCGRENKGIFFLSSGILYKHTNQLIYQVTNTFYLTFYDHYHLLSTTK